jgi:hypothetical protein
MPRFENAVAETTSATLMGLLESHSYQLDERGPPSATLNKRKDRMNHHFFWLLLLWASAGVCLVLLMRRHRRRMDAGFAW